MLEENELLPPSEVTRLDYHVSNPTEEKTEMLIITSSQREVSRCLCGITGPPAGLHEPLNGSVSLKVTDSFTRCNDGTAGGAIGAQTLKELQAVIRQLRELGRTAAESQVIKQAPILAASLEVTKATTN